MDFSEYQKKAIETCMPACFTHEYLDLGYLSEVGELAGKFAKRIRGDIVCDDELKLELGDIAWMIAVKATKINLDISIPNHWLLRTYFESELEIINSLKSYEDNQEAALTELVSATVFLGFDFQEVMDYNIKKLSSRKKRGVINGNGDYR